MQINELSDAAMHALAGFYVRYELPGWGKVYDRFIGGWRKESEWRKAAPKIFKNKINDYWFITDLSEWPDRAAYFLKRWYDLPLARTVTALVDPGDSVLDVGANYGHFALHAAKAVGPSGKVFAFEPNPRAFARLSVHADLNRISWIIARRAALGRTNATATLRVPFINSGEATLGRSVYASTDVEEVETPVLLGEEALKGVTPTFVKIDVEGFEVEVLTGLERIIAESRPTIVTEIVRRHLVNAGTSPEALMDYLASMNYVPMRMDVVKRTRVNFRHFVIEDGDGDALWAPAERRDQIQDRLSAAGSAFQG